MGHMQYDYTKLTCQVPHNKVKQVAMMQAPSSLNHLCQGHPKVEKGSGEWATVKYKVS